MENEFIVSKATDVTTFAGQFGLTYEPAVPDDPGAVLTQRSRPDDPRMPVPRERWRFLPPVQEGGPGRVRLDGGFQPGVIYELTYVARNPFVTGAGLAGIRDLLAFFRDNAFEGAAPPSHVMIFGLSQSARVVARMLTDGLDVDEDGRLAFDSAFLQVPGAGGTQGFNTRFAQPTRHPSMLEEHDYPSDAFPFTSAPSRDPVSGLTASSLDRAGDAQGRLPRIVYSNNSTEFWNREASLLTTTPDGTADVVPAPNVRVYAVMGAQHYVNSSHVRAPLTNCVSTTDHYLVMRSLILALDRWSLGGEPPPSSAYPQLADGTLVSMADYARTFPGGVGLEPLVQGLAEPRLDFGPRFAGAGIADTVPPAHGPAYEPRIPAPDADGNDKGGIQPIELRVPLGTHLGWNHRSPDVGFPWATARYDGSFVPFARTEGERSGTGDPRPSLAARYPTREAFIAKVRAAAEQEVQDGFLLPEDVARAVDENAGLYDRIVAHDPADQSCN